MKHEDIMKDLAYMVTSTSEKMDSGYPKGWGGSGPRFLAQREALGRVQAQEALSRMDTIADEKYDTRMAVGAFVSACMLTATERVMTATMIYNHRLITHSLHTSCTCQCARACSCTYMAVRVHVPFVYV